MATWHYTNTSGTPVIVDFPNLNAPCDAHLAPGQTVTFNDSGDAYMTVYEAVNGEPGAELRRGKIREVAQPGNGPT